MEDIEISELNVRKRNKRGKPEDWKASINKKNRLDGKAYFGKKKVDGVWSYNVHKNPRELKKACNCKRKTKNEGKLKYLDITEIERQKLFKSYWALNNEDAKLQFLKGIIKMLLTARKIDLSSTKKTSSIEYYLSTDNKRDVRVCKTMFLNTFCISQNMIKKLCKVINNETAFIDNEDNNFR